MQIITITSCFPATRSDYGSIFILKVLEKINVINHVVVPQGDQNIYEELLPNGYTHWVQYGPRMLTSVTSSSVGGGIPETIKNHPWTIIFYPIMILAMLIRVAKLAHNKSILHAHWLPNGLVGVVVKKLKKCSLVVTLRGSDQKLLSIPLFNYLCKWILKNSDAVTTVSEILSKRIIRDYRIGEKTFFISNGVDIINTTLPEISESGRFKVLFVGNLTKAKGIYDLLESLTKFKGEKNFFVDIIGDGPEKKNLLRTINNNNLYKYVSFSGRLSPQKVQKRMLSTHCFVLPSHSEGSPNVVKEAMACARPVIATNVGGTPELIEHGVNGLLFEPGDNQTLREHITYLSENRKVAQEMGLQARQFIIDQDLTWENTANQYMKIYKNVNEKI